MYKEEKETGKQIEKENCPRKETSNERKRQVRDKK
jgi:hypothetical protein